MARSRPARAVPVVPRTAPQSDTTTPSKPHSLFSGSVSRAFAVIVVPLTALYPAMTSRTPAATAASKGAR
ncbi:hypothetical protein B0E38_07748 [Streptomyces sp. 111WW2]|nr:hypothetical protein B0E38_07748 [Streptomyces sp. 111WW2]